MNIEQKAKAYDSIIEKANKMHSENCEACQECIEELIPELKENDDERIRGAIIHFISHTPTVPKGFIGKKTMLAWLEKQGNANKEYWIGYREGKQEILYKYAELEKQGGQNLAESEDERIRKAMINGFNKLDKSAVWYNGITNGQILAWLEKQGEQKPAEWSEEDEKMIGNIRRIIEQYAFSKSAVDVNGELCEKEFIDADNWLKSLRPQNTWKPSEEQIKVLEFFIPYVTKCNVVLQKSKDTLLSLLTDLKKLKEE